MSVVMSSTRACTSIVMPMICAMWLTELSSLKSTTPAKYAPINVQLQCLCKVSSINFWHKNFSHCMCKEPHLKKDNFNLKPQLNLQPSCQSSTFPEKMAGISKLCFQIYIHQLKRLLTAELKSSQLQTFKTDLKPSQMYYKSS